jgi:integrase/recombinase XerC/integrase/recombinase XerD
MGSVHQIRAAAEAVTLGQAAEAYAATLNHPESRGTARVYGVTLRALRQRFGDGCDVARIAPGDVAAWFAGRWGQGAPATWNRHRDALGALSRYCAAQGWGTADLTAGTARRRRAPDRSRALARADVETLLTRDGTGIRERVLWRLLYESAARSAEVLRLDVTDLDLPNRRARVVRKASVVDIITWQTGTARLLPRLLKGRKSGPVFLTDRRARVQLPPGDLDPASGRARLSYRQAAGIFEQATAGMPGGPWNLHQLRHSALTHAAEGGASTSTLLAYSGHASVQSLARYARVSPEALGHWQAQRDPARRR